MEVGGEHPNRPIACGATTRRMCVPTHSQEIPKQFPSSSQAFQNDFKA